MATHSQVKVVSEHKCDNTKKNHVVELFMASKLSYHIAQWREITSDKWVIDAVQHYHIEFTSMPYQTRIPKDLQCTPYEAKIIATESCQNALKRSYSRNEPYRRWIYF